jgi:Domain of unknown function (DUF4190)
MTSPGSGYGEESQDHTPPFPRPAEPQPWQQYQHPPVDPQAPVNYPEYPPPYPPQPPLGPPPGPSAGPFYGFPPIQPPSYAYPPPPSGYGGPPYYPGSYDPYQGYQPGPQHTNGLAVASLVTSIIGVVLGIPLAAICYVGVLIPIVGAVLGGVALGQIKRTNQQGRGFAIAGIAIGATTAAVMVILIAVLAAAVHSLTTNWR